MNRPIHQSKSQRILFNITAGQGDIYRNILLGLYRLIESLRGVIDRIDRNVHRSEV